MVFRKALIDSGVCYHHGLSQPGQPLADFERIPIEDLARTDLEQYDLLLVPRSSDAEALRPRRFQIARFLDRGGVLMAFGELWTNWFPGCRWEGECPEDIRRPVIAAPDHPLLRGLSTDDLHWHPERERWCCHGHLVAPPGAEVLVRNARGDAWMYVDRASTRGVILASSNIDPDTHAFHGSQVARDLLARMLAWAESEAGRSAERRAGAPRRIAGLYSGVHFQHAFYGDPEFSHLFSIVPAAELDALNLSSYAALWVPRESNQAALVRNRERLERYLAEGGVLVSFEEVNRPWLVGAEWVRRSVDVGTLHLARHPLLGDLAADDVRWHAHGAFRPPAGAEVLIADGEGDALLYLDERQDGGAILAGTLDPDCHAGFGSGRTRPLLRAILAWLHHRAAQPVGAP